MDKIPKLKADRPESNNGIIVLDELTGVIFCTINSQFAHLAPQLVEAVNKLNSVSLETFMESNTP